MSVPEVVPDEPLVDELELDEDELDDEDELLLLDEPEDDPLDELDEDEDELLPVDELPVDEVMLPEVLQHPPDDELELDEEELDDDELDELDDELEATLPDELVTLPEDEVTLPELVETLPDDEVTLPELDEVELVTLPEVVELEMFPLDVEVDEPPLPPELVEVDEPVVELSISISMLMPDVVPLVPDVLDEPDVVVVVDRSMLAEPPPPLPPKNPPKKPPPKPPPKPPDPPITTAWPPPPPLMRWPCSGSGRAGSGRAITSGSGSTSITRRMRRVSRCGRRRSTTRRALWLSFTSTSCGWLSDLYETVAACGSATCTAPPAISAVPAAAADNFARANLIDMPCLSSHFPANRWGPMPTLRFFHGCKEPGGRRNSNAQWTPAPGELSILCRQIGASGRFVPHWNRKRPNG